MKKLVIVVRTEWVTLWNAIKSLLGDKPLVSAIVGLLVTYLVARDPNLNGQAGNIQNAILVVVGLIIGTYKLTDIIAAIASVYNTTQAAKQTAMSANTAALNANAAATTRLIAAQSITSGVPSRKEPTFLSDASAPQGTDPARTAPTASATSVG